MGGLPVPSHVPNLIADADVSPTGEGWAEKLRPQDGQLLCRYGLSGANDVGRAVAAAMAAQPDWAAVTPVRRGEILNDVTDALRAHLDDMAEIVHAETGKSLKDARGETGGAIQQGRYWAGEGMRLHGRSLTSGSPGKYCMTVRQPLGVAGLIVPANTPIANIAWKVFPALICGNAAVLKASEDAPLTAWLFGRIAREAGLPPGVLNIVHGKGDEAGAALVGDERVALVSFTGSTRVGRVIGQVCAGRLARVSLELGGKNPLVVCDDADLDNAVRWAALSAFSNAGQRCAAGSRIIVYDSIYEEFRKRFVAHAESLKVGAADTDDFGPVINERQLRNMIEQIGQAVSRGARLLTGGKRLTDPARAQGFFLAPTILENVPTQDDLSCEELFGPITVLYRVRDFGEALALANATPFGLTAVIHTRNVHRAVEFGMKVRAGVANVNIGTYGSEPHMPFGGFGQSGNGTREPGVEALDVYSELKNIALTVDPEKL